MTNEERIYNLCEYMMDLIDAIKNKESNLEWIRDEIVSIRKDIDNRTL